MSYKAQIDVNGVLVQVDADPDTPFLYVLRNDLGLRAAKLGCGLEQCRACAVLVDGVAVPTCVTPLSEFVGRTVVTLEGLADGGRLHAVAQAFLDEEAAQCGYCTAGMIVGAVALLNRCPHPSEDEIRAALDPHLCRCGSHWRVIRAVRRAAGASA